MPPLPLPAAVRACAAALLTLAVVVSTALLLPDAEAGGGGGKTPADLKKAAKSIDSKLIKKHLFYLASDKLQGREAGSPGGHAAAVYIAEQYERAGLEPAGTEGFFQPFGPAPQRGEVALANAVKVATSSKATRFNEFDFDDAFRPAKFSATGLVEGTVVWAGYGITAEEHGYDDYANLDAEGKIVLCLDQEPQEDDDASPFDGAKPTAYSNIRTKAETAAEQGAIALIVVNGENHADEPEIPDDDELAWPPASDAEALPIPVVYANGKLAAEILKKSRKRIGKLQEEIDQTLTSNAVDLKSYPVIVKVSAVGPPIGGMKNVVALKRGSDPELKNQYVVLSAHYDHVGLGSPQTSKGGIGQVHNGSDDNGSGTSGLIELARALKTLKLKRSVLLMSFDAEEKGLVGSKHYAGSPTVPMGNIVTILNMDMISRNAPDEIFVGGMGRNAMLDRVIGEIGERYKLRLNPQGMEQYIRRSDQWSFMERGVPGLFFYGGSHADYHTANDTPDKANLTKIKLITQVCLVFLYDIANAETSPRG